MEKRISFIHSHASYTTNMYACVIIADIQVRETVRLTNNLGLIKGSGLLPDEFHVV